MSAVPNTLRRPRLNLEAISHLAEIADYSPAFALRAIAAVGVVDHLADGPRHIGNLAELAHCNRQALTRVMRALVKKSVFTEGPAETFGLQPMGELLRSDHPLSMRWFFRSQPDVQALAGLEETLRTGKPAFEGIFHMDYFDWLAANPPALERFRESQRALNRMEVLAITRSYPWHEAASVVDVGGNDGSLLVALLQRYPNLSGTNFDLPGTAEDSYSTFERTTLKGRARVICGNIFDGGIPSGSDLYVMKRILVGFSDELAEKALVSVRRAMAPESRLLIMEPMGDGPDHVGTSLDLLMLVLNLGRVRPVEDFIALVERAGLRKTRTRSAGLVTILEAQVGVG